MCPGQASTVSPRHAERPVASKLPMLLPLSLTLTVCTRLADTSDCVALVYGGQGIAAADLRASIFRYARALSSLGIGRGNLVALLAPNRPDALAIRYATNLVGAAATFLSAPRTPAARAALVSQIAPDLLVLFLETAHLLPGEVHVRVAAAGADLPGRIAAARPTRRGSVGRAGCLPCPSRRRRRNCLLRWQHRRAQG